jgi:hypothetical protein
LLNVEWKDEPMKELLQKRTKEFALRVIPNEITAILVSSSKTASRNLKNKRSPENP